MNRNGGHRSNNLYYRVNSYQENSYTVTPPDRFLARSHLIEMRATPKSLLNSKHLLCFSIIKRHVLMFYSFSPGSQWDPLSKSIWSKFSNSQQTEETYKRKMYLWRYLYLCIRVCSSCFLHIERFYIQSFYYTEIISALRFVSGWLHDFRIWFR